MLTLNEAIDAVALDLSEKGHDNLMGGAMTPFYGISFGESASVVAIVYGVRDLEGLENIIYEKTLELHKAKYG